MTTPLDHGLYARQIALEELGATGQLRLAAIPVAFTGLPEDAAAIYLRAGGRVSRDPSALIVSIDPPHPTPGPARVGMSAWGAIEAARRVLGEAPLPLPKALLARLTEP